jgi:hypothetical protein
MPIAHAGGEAKGDQAASTKAILRQAQGLSPPLRVNAHDHAVLYHRQSHALRHGDCRPRLRHAGQMTLDEITGDSPYGVTTIAGGDGSAETRSLWTKRRHIAAFRARPASVCVRD